MLIVPDAIFAYLPNLHNKREWLIASKQFFQVEQTYTVYTIFVPSKISIKLRMITEFYF